METNKEEQERKLEVVDWIINIQKKHKETENKIYIKLKERKWEK